MRALLAALVLAGPALAQDSTAFGTWQTEAAAGAAPLQVYVAPCGYDTARVCGQIVRAGDDAENALVGRAIITGMLADEDGGWQDGQFWVPEEDRTYRATMRRDGDALTVTGCVALFCRSQSWTRVE